jgi:hypothetical protein
MSLSEHHTGTIMKKNMVATLLALGIFCLTQTPARAQSEVSAVSALSALPLSVVVGVSAVTGASIAAPAVLSATGAVLVVKAVEVGVRGTVYVLERVSDGARVSVEVVGHAAAGASIATGMLVTVSVIGSGVILSAAGEVIAFVPNALGRALLHNERLTY